MTEPAHGRELASPVTGVQYFGPGGPAEVVFLHGLGSTAHFMAPSAEFIGNTPGLSVNSVVFDLPGHGAGRSVPLTIPSFEEYVFWVARSISQLDTVPKDRLLLVGHSLGGLLVLALARDHGYERGICLIDGVCFDAVDVLQRSFAGGIREHGIELSIVARWIALAVGIEIPNWLIEGTASNKVGRVVGLWPYLARPTRVDGRALADGLIDSGNKTVGRGLRAICSLDVDRLLQVLAPVAVINGASDRLISQGDRSRARQAINPLEWFEIPRAGHLPMFDEPAEYHGALETSIGTLLNSSRT